jgi:hypothetical protein
MADSHSNLPDRLIQRLKNNRFVAPFIVAGIFVTALAGLSGSITTLWERFTKPSRLAILALDANIERTLYRRRQTADVCAEVVKAMDRVADSSKLTLDRCFPDYGSPRGFVPFSAAQSEVPYLFEIPMLDASSPEAAKELALGKAVANSSDPVFYVVIGNPTSASITVLDLTVTVKGAVGVNVLNFLSQPLLPVQDYVIPVSPSPGVYHRDPDIFAPAVLIGPQESLAVNVRLRPKGKGQSLYGFYLVASIDVHWKGGQVSSVPFMVDLKDDGSGFSSVQ